MKQLVLIHGRAQQMKDAVALKQTWVAALRQGMLNAGLNFDLDESRIHFPYYGDALVQRIDNAANPTPVVIKGKAAYTSKQLFQAQFFTEAIHQSVPNEQVEQQLAAADPQAAHVTEKGALNWPWVLAGLRAIDALHGGSWAVETFTNDVYQYLTDDDLQNTINTGVAGAFTSEPTVVVAHSLGTVVAFCLLKSDAATNWHIPTLITLGCPLAVGPVAQGVRPLIKPDCVTDWYNGRDPQDTVALFPLDPPRFPVTLAGEKNTIHNTSANHHGIESYLADADVARWIYNAIK